MLIAIKGKVFFSQCMGYNAPVCGFCVGNITLIRPSTHIRVVFTISFVYSTINWLCE